MPAQIHRLFFALRPDATLRGEIERSVQALKAAGRVHGRWLRPEKLHMTVRFLGDFAVADDIARRASHAAAGLHFAAFEFVLDRAETFPRKFNPPCVLRCAGNSEAALQHFAHELGDVLAAAGLAEFLQARAYVPHVTIAYAERELPKPVALAPILWGAREFCLIDSVGGAHNEIARWPLHT